MKKIAIFQTDLSMGGIQKSLVNMLNIVDYNKYEVDLYLFKDNNFYNANINKKVNIIYLKPLPYIARLIFFSILKKFKHYKIDKEYDIAIDYNSYDQSCSIACLNAKAKKHIMWVHNDVLMEREYDIKYRILHFFFKSKYKYFDKYVCVSQKLISSFKSLNKIKHDNFIVIPNLILSDEIIEKSKEKIDINIDSSKYNLVSVGRFVIQKGFDILINDMKYITSKRKDVHLYIIGDGKHKRKIEKLIIKNNLSSYITLLGPKSNPFCYEKLMDGFVIESRYEGQGIVILEAKVLGLDLIIPDRLEGYIDGVSFTNNICETIISIKKNKNKKINKLIDYNKDVIDKINQFFMKG